MEGGISIIRDEIYSVAYTDWIWALQLLIPSTAKANLSCSAGPSCINQAVLKPLLMRRNPFECYPSGPRSPLLLAAFCTVVMQPE